MIGVHEYNSTYIVLYHIMCTGSFLALQVLRLQIHSVLSQYTLWCGAKIFKYRCEAELMVALCT